MHIPGNVGALHLPTVPCTLERYMCWIFIKC